VTVSGSLASKPAMTVSGGLASKPVTTVFVGLASKSLVMVFSSLASKPEVSMRHASRSSGLLHVEASLARVSQSGLKTGGGAMTGGARGTIAEAS
jgi:hypothetical protein